MGNLRYIGAGAYRPDMPARDLDDAEIAVFAKRRGIGPEAFVAEALGSGLYAADVSAAEAKSAKRKKAAPAAEAKPLDQMGRDELRAACADLGLGQAGSKDDLLERIRAKLAETDETPAADSEDETEADPQ